MTSLRAKLIPIIAGILILLLLAGFIFGLRTVIEFDPVHDQVRTTRNLYYAIPISTTTEPLWIAQTQPSTTAAPDWQLMHEIRQSAAGTKINHTHWGSVADTIGTWADLDLPAPTREHLAQRTNDLIASDHPVREVRVFIIRIDTYLRYQLATTDTPPTVEDIDAHFEKAITTPIED